MASMIAGLVVALVSAGCAGQGGEAKAGGPPGGAPAADPAGPVAGSGVTAARLGSALLPRIPGYTPFGQPESGAYAALRSVRQGSALQRAATLDKPECAQATQGLAGDDRVRRAPAASVSFARSSRLTVHEMLIAVPADVAAERVDYRVPESCRSYRARIDGQSFGYRVLERGASASAAGGQLGAGSRTVGIAVSTKSDGARQQTKIWHVAFRDDGYVGFITLSGALAERAEAEDLARRAYAEAERTLP
jgi:hypothetical protein